MTFSLGSSAEEGASGLIEPIEVTVLPFRAGLGMPEKPISAERPEVGEHAIHDALCNYPRSIWLSLTVYGEPYYP